ncbi:hypothetical protein C8R43DRAFT_991319 [Mycena crocata]|nr:hypothetical protein C8R43DRAFT_991319 [Mycena crocata]
MSTARDTVLSTPELLEHILTQLPMRDLLVRAPLVSKTWQAITLTPTVQRALFFLPEAPSASKPVQNPLLVEAFAPFFTFCPEDKHRWSWPGDASSIESLPWAKAPDTFKRADASWRRMLVTQPPAQRLLVTDTSHGRGGNSTHSATLDNGPLHMGTLYDLAAARIDRVASSFCVRWHRIYDVDRESGIDDAEGGSSINTDGESKANRASNANANPTSQPDVTLATIYTVQCTGHRSILESRFYSDGMKQVALNFGDWVRKPHH